MISSIPSSERGPGGITFDLNVSIAFSRCSIALLRFWFCNRLLDLLLIVSFRSSTDFNSISFVEAPGNLKGFGKN